MKSNKITLFNTPIDALTLNDTLSTINSGIAEKRQLHHMAVNVAKVVNMQRDKMLFESVLSADIINADGLPLVWVSRLLGTPLPERVTGVDLMQALVKLAFEKRYKIFFLGAEEEVVADLVKKYSIQYSEDIIAGCRNGYFNKDEEESIADMIASSGAHILFVAMSSPKKEIFLHKYKRKLSGVNFIMGVGGSFDVVVGKVKRAPLWMQNIGLEWLFRVMQEPRRMWKRYLVTNILFLYYTFKELIDQKRRQ